MIKYNQTNYTHHSRRDDKKPLLLVIQEQIFDLLEWFSLEYCGEILSSFGGEVRELLKRYHLRFALDKSPID